MCIIRTGILPAEDLTDVNLQPYMNIFKILVVNVDFTLGKWFIL